MPLVKRTVNPTHLCRQKIPRGMKNDLECVTNNTLSGVIHQLASLSQHAEDIFGELFSEANTFYGRASLLKDRIDKLSVKVTQLDSNVEEVSLIDINSRKAFKSSITTDQQVVSRQSLSRSVSNTYNLADAPPPLQELNQFRDDGKDGLKIYTDPDYFFDLWREAIQKETREAREKRREQRKKDRKANPNYMRKQEKVRQAVNTRRAKAERMRHGAEFIESAPAKQQGMSGSQRRSSGSQRQHREPPAPVQNEVQHPPPAPHQPQVNNHVPPAPPIESNVNFPEPPPVDLDLPPPEPMFDASMLPPPIESNIVAPPPPPMPMVNGDAGTPAAPTGVPPPPPLVPAPPPPPPPMMNMDNGDADSGSPSGLAAALQNVSLKKSQTSEAKPVDERSNLLQAIRVGINLRKVEQKEKSAPAPSSGGNDVASILARRIAVEFSDSDESDSTLASDEDWDD